MNTIPEMHAAQDAFERDGKVDFSLERDSKRFFCNNVSWAFDRIYYWPRKQEETNMSTPEQDKEKNAMLDELNEDIKKQVFPFTDDKHPLFKLISKAIDNYRPKPPEPEIPELILVNMDRHNRVWDRANAGYKIENRESLIPYIPQASAPHWEKFTGKAPDLKNAEIVRISYLRVRGATTFYPTSFARIIWDEVDWFFIVPEREE